MAKFIVVNKKLNGPVFIGEKKFEFKNGATIVEDEETIERVKKLEVAGFKLVPYDEYIKKKQEKESQETEEGKQEAQVEEKDKEEEKTEEQKPEPQKVDKRGKLQRK